MSREIDPVRAARKVSRVVRGAVLRLLIRVGGGQCGAGLEVEPGTTLRWGPHRGVVIGRGVRFGRGVVLDVPRGAELRIGDRAKVMHYTVIAASERIAIGARTQIAEHCTIRDADHVVDRGRPGIAEALVTETTTVGADVWLARGVAVLRGASVGDGAVVGANSVVVRGRPVAAGARVAGAPARPLA